MNFFFDRSMPKRLARMLDIFETMHTVRHHDDDGRFEQDTPDAVWLSTIAQDPEPWIIISGDGRILKNKAERAALRETGFTFFCMSKQWLHMDLRKEYAWKFLRVWPRIVDNADITTQKIFEVSGGSSLKVERKELPK